MSVSDSSWEYVPLTLCLTASFQVIQAQRMEVNVSVHTTPSPSDHICSGLLHVPVLTQQFGFVSLEL